MFLVRAVTVAGLTHRGVSPAGQALAGSPQGSAPRAAPTPAPTDHRHHLSPGVGTDSLPPHTALRGPFLSQQGKLRQTEAHELSRLMGLVREGGRGAMPCGRLCALCPGSDHQGPRGHMPSWEQLPCVGPSITRWQEAGGRRAARRQAGTSPPPVTGPGFTQDSGPGTCGMPGPWLLRWHPVSSDPLVPGPAPGFTPVPSSFRSPPRPPPQQAIAQAICPRQCL